MAKYTKRLALIATSRDLVKEIEELIIKSLVTNTYEDVVASINHIAKCKLGCRIIPMSLRNDKEVFTEFAKEYGELSPLIGAVLEYDEDAEEIKRSGF